MPDIVISEFIEPHAISQGLRGFDVHHDKTLVDQPEALKALLGESRALIVRNATPVTADVMDAGPNLVCIGRLGVGLDNIDVEAARARGIAVYPATGANAVSVAEWVIATAMVLLRGAYGSTLDVIAGTWPRENLIAGREIFGKRLGLVGFGSIARETALRGAALGMSVAAYDPFVAADDPAWTQPFGRVERLTLDEIVATSDVISLHVPLTAETRNLIDAGRLLTSKPGAILINGARGGIVDEAALAQALQEGNLGGAALDVFVEEPLSAAKAAVFVGCPNLILTPHIAGRSLEANERVSSMVVERVRAHLEGLAGA
ncbi:hydroxyacid dehydrogenase [uncultured Enterovirga sp.]|uniref:hydroxyacid dehydrogenase n=1 Tax=uncultured Enterovirga sp. TaxID=2026352 RepID=UPI0035CC510C